MDAPRQARFEFDDEPVLEWTFGPVRVTRVVEGISTFNRSIFLPRLTEERLDACGDWTAPYLTGPYRNLRFSCHSFIVETPDNTIVVDTCVGSHRERMMQADPTFLDRLTTVLGGDRSVVDVVVCTHLHFDHIGVNTVRVDDELRPTFPNARYLVSDAELEATMADDHMDVVDESIRPLLDAGCLDAVPSDHRIDEWVTLVPSPGHSRGHVCVRIVTEEGEALITGDAAHSPMQFTYPDVSSELADDDSATACRTREALLDDLVDSGTVVLGTHYPTPTAGVLVSGDLVEFRPIAARPSS